MVRCRHLPSPLTTQASLAADWGYGGLIAAAGVQPEEVVTVLADLTGRPVLLTSVWPNALAGERWAAARRPGVMWIPRLAHMVDLKGGFDHVFTISLPFLYSLSTSFTSILW